LDAINRLTALFLCLKNTLFFTYFTFLQHLSIQSVRNALFSSCLYEAPPFKKRNVL